MTIRRQRDPIARDHGAGAIKQLQIDGDGRLLRIRKRDADILSPGLFVNVDQSTFHRGRIRTWSPSIGRSATGSVVNWSWLKRTAVATNPLPPADVHPGSPQASSDTFARI